MLELILNTKANNMTSASSIASAVSAPLERKSTVPPLNPEVLSQVRAILLNVIGNEALTDILDDIKIISSSDWGASATKIRSQKLAKMTSGNENLDAIFQELKWLQSGTGTLTPMGSIDRMVRRVQGGDSVGELAVTWWNNLRGSVDMLAMRLLRLVYADRHPSYRRTAVLGAGGYSPPSTLLYGYSAGDIKESASTPTQYPSSIPTGPVFAPPYLPLLTPIYTPPAASTFAGGAYVV